MTTLSQNISTLVEGNLNELTTALLSRYKTAAGKDASALDKTGVRSDTLKANKRFKGIVKATNKQFDNDKAGK